MVAVSPPSKPGFYWAKWRIADLGTHEAEDLSLNVNNDWEVVEAFENSLDETAEEYLRVFVGGVRESQSLENFVWGSGRLEAPKNEPPKSRPDFIVGLRGGDWYAFSNGQKATDHIRKNGTITASNANLVTRALEHAGFTWKMEAGTK